MRPRCVRVWWAAPADAADPLTGPALAALLDDEQSARVARLRRPEDRERSVAAHALLRIVVGQELGLHPREVRIGRRCLLCGSTEHGKPYVMGVPDLHVSVSHSGDRVAVAVSDEPVGVDVEVVGEPHGVAAQVLAPEELAALEGLSGMDRTRAFSDFWVQKEAATKATGHGLGTELSAVVVPGPRSATGRATVLGQPLAVAALDAGAGYAAAVATVGTRVPQVSQHDGSALLRNASSAGQAGRATARRGPARTVLGLTLLALLVVVVLSIAVGSRSLSLAEVLDGLLHPQDSAAGAIVRELRVPRTLLGLAVGAALGLAGALMQALTRNPLADPGLLGVNAGAATAVVLAISVLGLSSPASYVLPALLGAALAAFVVYVLGSTGRTGATPVRLALAGTAVGAALTSFTSGLSILDPATFDTMRFWQVGSLAGHPVSTLWQVGPFLLVGAVLALSLARPLNALALGEDAARAVGAPVARTRALGAVAVTLLCGAATAAVGPIGFLGLTVPHVARAFVGPDQRWVLPLSALMAPVLLLAADVVGRLVVRPDELQASIITALVGAPFFVLVVRRRRLAQL